MGILFSDCILCKIKFGVVHSLALILSLRVENYNTVLYILFQGGAITVRNIMCHVDISFSRSSGRFARGHLKLAPN